MTLSPQVLDPAFPGAISFIGLMVISIHVPNTSLSRSLSLTGETDLT